MILSTVFTVLTLLGVSVNSQFAPTSSAAAPAPQDMGMMNMTNMTNSSAAFQAVQSALFGLACPKDCVTADCGVGQYCQVENCTVRCDGQAPYQTCMQSFMNSSYVWQEFDCMAEGVKGKDQLCVDTCAFNDCTADFNVNVCWKEECDDGCGKRNCSVWQQDGAGNWFGSDCGSGAMMMDNFRMQDVANTINTTVHNYENTIMDVFTTFCNDTGCMEGQQELQNFFDGVPPPTPAEQLNETLHKDVCNGTCEDELAMARGMANQTLAGMSGYTDMFFGNAEYKDLLLNFVNDTAMAQGVNPAGMAPTEALLNSNSTMEANQMIQQTAMSMNMTDLLGNLSQQTQGMGFVHDTVNFFQDAFMNFGMMRKGTRDGMRRRR